MIPSSQKLKLAVSRIRQIQSTLGLGLASVWILGALLIALQSGSAVAAEMQIGFVDMQKALQTVDAGKKAKAQLEKEFNSKKKELQSEEAAIQKMGEEFKKQQMVMSDEGRMKKQQEIQERIMKFQQMTARSQSEIQQKQDELTQPIIGKLRAIVADLAKQKGYSLVLEKNENTVLFHLEKDDMTTEVINQFNKQSKVSLGSGSKSPLVPRVG